jgi:hypothetical protein
MHAPTMSDRPRITDPFALLRRLPIKPMGERVEPDRLVTEGLDDGRPRTAPWLTTDLYCPHCGKQPVHIEAGDGDDYVGATHWCCSCQTQFFLP